MIKASCKYLKIDIIVLIRYFFGASSTKCNLNFADFLRNGLPQLLLAVKLCCLQTVLCVLVTRNARCESDLLTFHTTQFITLY